MNFQTQRWIFIAAFFSAFTVLTIKHYEKNGGPLLLLVALASEVALIYSYIQLLKSGDVLAQFALVKIISILIVVIPTTFFFGSVLTIPKIFGLIFGLIAIYLLM